MELEIRRRYAPEQTFGDLYLYKENNGIGFSCRTLELKWDDNKTSVSCIPEGEYIVVVRYSKKYGRHLHVTGVEGRELILVHPANFVGSVNPKSGKSDLRGCIAVGSDYYDIDKDGIRDIVNSKKTFDKLMSFFDDDNERVLLKIHSV